MRWFEGFCGFRQNTMSPNTECNPKMPRLGASLNENNRINRSLDEFTMEPNRHNRIIATRKAKNSWYTKTPQRESVLMLTTATQTVINKQAV